MTQARTVRLAVIGSGPAGMGCMAALEAARFLAEEDHKAAHNPISHKEAEKIGAW